MGRLQYRLSAATIRLPRRTLNRRVVIFFAIVNWVSIRLLVCCQEGRASMVQLFVSSKSPQTTVVSTDLQTSVAVTPSDVKMENVELTGQAERSSRSKRAKFAVPCQQQQWSVGPSSGRLQSTHVNPLDEPSPLGLTLKKTPSLLDLIQMKLSQGDPAFSGQEAGKKRDIRSSAAQTSADKLKASNFPVSILRIGTWECISRYEGDLVAKCYFAKHKLVWEVLDGGLKSKIEIQWSDITALKANYPEDEPGTLDIEVSRPPLFFRETNPQPRKHTLWQATSDFTGGQATICRRHFLQCPQGLLNRHYEKLIQCDPRLNLLSQKAFLSEASPCFDSKSTVFQDRDEQSCYGKSKENGSHVFTQFNHLKEEYLAPFSCFPEAAPPIAHTLVPKFEPLEPEVRTVEAIPQETFSPSSVMDLRAIEDHGNSDSDELNMKGGAQWEQLQSLAPFNGSVHGASELTFSTSMSTLVNQLGSCFQEQIRSSNSVSTGENTSSSHKRILDEISQHLLGDSLLSATFDEQSIIARVNSMCSLLQKDASNTIASETSPGKVEESVTGYDLAKDALAEDGELGDEVNNESSAFLRRCELVPSQLFENSPLDSKQSTVIPRKESSGDLLLHLPRIASLPHFFIHASDELAMRNDPTGKVGGT